MARERSELILADIDATRAERNPDFAVLTFECAGKPGGMKLHFRFRR